MDRMPTYTRDNFFVDKNKIITKSRNPAAGESAHRKTNDYKQQKLVALADNRHDPYKFKTYLM